MFGNPIYALPALGLTAAAFTGFNNAVLALLALGGAAAFVTLVFAKD